ncbi:LPD3 domain-containing protein, partial [Helicobacter bilis]
KPEVAKINPQSVILSESEKSINPHTESNTQINKDSVMLSAKHETSNLFASKDVSTFSKSQHDNIKDTDLLKNLYGNNKETNLYANMESNPNIKAQEKALNNEIDSNFTYTTQETKGIRDLRNDLKEALMPYLNKEIVNKETGIIAQISTTGLSKISSKKAVDKSIANGFTRDEHFKVAQDLKSLFENSKLKESHADTKARDEIQAVHRFTKSLQINGSQAEAKITLFENNQAGNKIYSLELEELKSTSLSPSAPQTKAEVADKAQSVGGDANPINIAKSDTDIIPQKLTERIKNDLDSNDYAEMLKSLKQLENKQAEIDTFTNEANLILNTLEKQETEKYEEIVSALFDKYPIMKEFYNERDINTHIYFKDSKNKFLERYNTQYDFFTLDEKAFLAKYPNFTQQDYKEATTQNLKALKDKNVSINEYVSFAKEYMDIVNNPVFEKMSKEIDSVNKKYWDTHFEMSDQRNSKVNEIIAILKKDIDSIDIANKADVNIDNFHKLGRYLAFMKQPEFGFVKKLTFTKTGFFGKFLEQTDIKQRELLGKLLSVEKLLEKTGKANRVLQDRLFTVFRLMRGEELLDREIKDVPLARELIEKQLNIKPIKEFGTNYAEHYHSGESAIQKLINEAQAHKESGAKGEYKGQVAGAFHRDDIGDITLAWGEKGTGKSDGWGLSKIIEYHPEVLDKLDKLIQDLPIVKETENRYKLDNGDFFISIRKDFEGQKQNWVLTALERDESIARRRTDLPSSQSEAEKTTSANADDIIPQTPKDNNDPLKTFEYFKDDFIKAYPKALEFHDGHMPMANYLSHYAKEEIQEANKALFNTAKDEFSHVLKDIGLKKDEVKQGLDHANKYDVEYSLPKVREYLDYAEKNYNTLLQEQQVLAQGLINKKTRHAKRI